MKAKQEAPAGAVQIPLKIKYKKLYNVWLDPLNDTIHCFTYRSTIPTTTLSDNDYYFDNYFHAYAYLCRLQLRGYKLNSFSPFEA